MPDVVGNSFTITLTYTLYAWCRG